MSTELPATNEPSSNNEVSNQDATAVDSATQMQLMADQLEAVNRELNDLKQRQKPWIVRTAQGTGQRFRWMIQSSINQSMPTGEEDQSATERYPAWIQKLTKSARGRITLVISAAMILTGYCVIMYGLISN